MNEPIKSKKPMSSSHERMVKGYLRPSLFPKFEKFVEENEISESEALNEAVKLLVGQRQIVKAK